MSGVLKAKIAIAVGSMLIVALLAAVNSAMFEREVDKRWAPLTWDDFDGIPPIFTTYEAAVASHVDLEYDSSRSKFVAYAYQNNVGSWSKADTTTDGLRHEQYHFNITEIIARQLNAYIQENPEGNAVVFKAELESLTENLQKMQADYDRETDHSINTDKQRLWEFKIDSMLSLERGWVTDPYSGGRVYFPVVPDSAKGVVRQSAFRQYQLSKYGMYLNLVSLQNTELTTEQFMEKLRGLMREHYGGSVAIDNTGNVRARATYDSGGYRIKQMWVGKGTYVYSVFAAYDLDALDTAGYAHIADGFINSFRVTNTDNFWIQRSQRDNAQVIASGEVAAERPRSEKAYRTLYPQMLATQGFFRGPIRSSDGSLLIAYDFVVHPDSLHLDDVARLDNNCFLYHEPKQKGQLFRLPGDSVPKKDFSVVLGYLLKEDSAKRGFRLFQQAVFIHE